MPRGSSSKFGPENVSALNFDLRESIESPDNSSNPPSTAFNSSCVIVGLASDEEDSIPAYASHLPFQCSTNLE